MVDKKKMPLNILLISIQSDIHCFGLRNISTYLKRYGDSVCKITCLFLPGQIKELLKNENKNKILNFIGNGKFDIIGFSIMSNFMSKAKILTKEIKKVTNSIVIWGGIHPTIFPQECLTYCDYVCIGEGEEPFLKFIKSFNSLDCQNINNFGFKKKEKVVLNDTCGPIQDLDKIPVMDYDFDTNFIFLNNKIQKMGQKELKQFMGNNLTLITSRGCAFSCSYCCNSTLCKISKEYRKIRRQNPVRIINDIIYLRKKLGFIEHIMFDDDDFLSTDISNLKLFACLYKEKIKLPFYVTGIIAATLTEEKLAILVDAGLQNVRLGIQSGSDRVNYEIYNRRVPLDKTKSAISIINKSKKKLKLPRYDIIMDNPWETKDDKIKTVKFLNEIPQPFVINKFSLTLYPGTDLFDRAIKENRIKDIEKEVYNKKFNTPENTLSNFLIFVISIVKLPKFLVDFLLRKYYDKKIPFWAFKFFGFADILKRNLFLLSEFKLKTFLSAMKFSLGLRKK